MSVKKTFVFSRTKAGDPYVVPPKNMFHINISDLGQIEVVDWNSTPITQIFSDSTSSGGGTFSGGTIAGATNFTSTISSGGTNLDAIFLPRAQAETGVTVTSAVTSTTANDKGVLLVDATSGDITISLPSAASSVNAQIVIKKVDSSSNTVILDGNGSETIDGATTATITVQYESITIVCDGSNWYII